MSSSEGSEWGVTGQAGQASGAKRRIWYSVLTRELESMSSAREGARIACHLQYRVHELITIVPSSLLPSLSLGCAIYLTISENPQIPTRYAHRDAHRAYATPRHLHSFVSRFYPLETACITVLLSCTSSHLTSFTHLIRSSDPSCSSLPISAPSPSSPLPTPAQSERNYIHPATMPSHSHSHSHCRRTDRRVRGAQPVQRRSARAQLAGGIVE